MVKVKALTNIHDLSAGCIRPEGEEFDVSQERADELKSAKLVKILKSDYQTKEEKHKDEPKVEK